MPLGPQFSNTYWEDPKSKTVMSSTELPIAKGELPEKEQRTPQIAKGFGASKNSQGVLFSPHAYTGLKDDPTIPAEHRMGVINKSLGLKSLNDLNNIKNKQLQQNKDRNEHNTRETQNHPDNFARRNYRRPIPVYGDTKLMAQKDEALGRAANNLDIPTSTYKENISTHVAPTDWDLGESNWSGGALTVGVRPITNTEKVKEVQEYPASDKPIPNTKFWAQYEKQYKHQGDVHSVLWDKDIPWTNPEGHTMSSAELNEHPGANTNGYYSEVDAMDWLKSNNYHPNVYPTKGKSTPKYSVGKKVSIETGYSDRGNDLAYNYSPWHTRYEPDTTKEPKAVSIKKNTKVGYEANESTLAHEIGHTQEPYGDSPERDLNRRSRSRTGIIVTDPVSEGYADALTDRAYRYSGQFEKHLTDTKLRAKDISTTGYSSKYHMWNAHERALYSAVRFHVAAHPERINDMQNRTHMKDSMFSWRMADAGEPQPTTKLMLGHMYEHMPHVRPVLHELGFGKTSEEAHKRYTSRVPDPRFKGRGKKRTVYEQSKLPEM